MSGEEFDALVSRLENMSAENPAAYKLQVAALALLAYLYTFVVLLAAVCLATFFISVFFHKQTADLITGIPVALAVIFFWRAYWIRFKLPAGVQITASDSPRIFELVKELGGKLDCPKINAVYLNADFNASIYSEPQFAFLGNSKHYLYLGLPLMQSLSPEQFKAVLAHELAHISGNHGRLGSWVYSVRNSSAQILEMVRKRPVPGSIVLKKFFEWYYPYFNAYSFVLIRQHEYEADKRAAEISGAQTAALSLINSELKNRYVDLKFWKELFKQVDENPEPPRTPFHDLSTLMTHSKMDPDAYKWYQQALRRKTGVNQCHPALKERLEAIGKSSAERSNLDHLSADELKKIWDIETSAAQEYFEGKLADYEQRMDLAWHHAYDSNWKMLHRERGESRRLLEEYETKRMSSSLADEELLHLAELSVQLKSARESIPVLKEVIKRLPDNVSLNYNLGERLLAEGDLSGLEYLDKVVRMKPVYGLEICELLYETLMEAGDEKRAAEYLDKSLKFRAELQQAARERSGLKAQDKYIHYKISERELERIVMRLERFPDVKRAYLVCKDVAVLCERPFYVLVVEIKFPWHRIVSIDQKAILVKELSKTISLPSEGYVVEIGWAPGNLRKAIKTIAGAQIYAAKK